MKLGLIGNPVAHSRSPALHRAALIAAGLDGDYTAHRVAPGTVEDVVRSLWKDGVIGLNVTLPLKVEVLSLCDELSDVAIRAGAVNTLHRLNNGVIHGTNTDVSGGIFPLKQRGIELSGANVLVLGAGGAARGIVVGLLAKGVARIGVLNRTITRAQHLAAELNDARICTISIDSGELAAFQPSIIINATSIGLGSTPLNADQAFGWFQRLPLSSWSIVFGYDLVYSTQNTSGMTGWTPFRQVIQDAGAATIDGWEMLVRQAALSFAIWTKTDVETAYAAMLATPRAAR